MTNEDIKELEKQLESLRNKENIEDKYISLQIENKEISKKQKNWKF